MLNKEKKTDNEEVVVSPLRISDNVVADIFYDERFEGGFLRELGFEGCAVKLRYHDDVMADLQKDKDTHLVYKSCIRLYESFVMVYFFKSSSLATYAKLLQLVEEYCEKSIIIDECDYKIDNRFLVVLYEGGVSDYKEWFCSNFKASGVANEYFLIDWDAFYNKMSPWWTGLCRALRGEAGQQFSDRELIRYISNYGVHGGQFPRLGIVYDGYNCEKLCEILLRLAELCVQGKVADYLTLAEWLAVDVKQLKSYLNDGSLE